MNEEEMRKFTDMEELVYDIKYQVEQLDRLQEKKDECEIRIEQRKAELEVILAEIKYTQRYLDELKKKL